MGSTSCLFHTSRFLAALAPNRRTLAARGWQVRAAQQGQVVKRSRLWTCIVSSHAPIGERARAALQKHMPYSDSCLLLCARVCLLYGFPYALQPRPGLPLPSNCDIAHTFSFFTLSFASHAPCVLPRHGQSNEAPIRRGIPERTSVAAAAVSCPLAHTHASLSCSTMRVCAGKLASSRMSILVAVGRPL